MKNKGWGIILNPNSGLSPEEAFKEFLKMSDIEPLSSGGNGAIFKITIKDEYEEIIKELNGKIKKLKERVKELEK